MPRLIQRLFELTESANEAIALGAIKEALSYQLAKPKEAPTVNVNVQQANHAAHLASLAARVVQDNGGRPVNVLISHDNSEPSSKQPINRAPIIDASPVPVTASPAVTADRQNTS